MSMETDAERWSRIYLSEPKTARITPELIASALEGFSLPPRRDIGWLARGVQAAVYMVANADYPLEQGHAATRDELQLLAYKARGLWLDIFQMSSEAREQIDRFIWSPWVEGDKEASSDSIEPQTLAWNSATQELHWLGNFLDDAAKYVGAKKQGQKWKTAAMQYWRMQFAYWLAPTFQKGFGRKPGLSKPRVTNAWGQRRSGRRSLGHWADFYQRIMVAAFNEKATPNLALVLGLARKRGMPSFSAGMFPE